MGAGLELQRRGDAVLGKEPVALVALAVGVHVDEPGRHDMSAGIEHGGAAKGGRADRRDLAAPDTDPPHGVEARLGIDDSAARDDDVVLGLCTEEKSESEKH